MGGHVIDLKNAVYQIHSAYESLDHGQPFFFIVGAGVSAPSVPLAHEILDHCRRRAGGLDGGPEAPATGNALDIYSYWFDRAYPQPADRQRYLRALIQNRPLSDASLRLAHVLASKRAPTLVVTPNFDDFVSRALTVFGAPHTVSDHPDTVDRIDLASDEIKIVHVHGSYKFYDCRNLRDEVERRARPSNRTTRTMAAFLDRTLSFSSPLIVGYSGWEDDVIMSALRRRIEGASLPYRLYWFVYRLDELSYLEVRAPWLTDHPDVRVVAPASIAAEVTQTDPNGASEAGASAATLPAQVVFEQLTRDFDLGEPEITREPVAFFARQLRAILLQEQEQSNLEGIYSFQAVVERLERAAELENKDFHIRIDGGESASLDQIRQLVRRSQYTEVVKAAEPLVDKVTGDARIKLYELVSSALDARNLESKTVVLTADLLTRLADTTPRIAESERFPLERTRRLLAKGSALYNLDRYAEAIESFDMAIAGASLGGNDEIASLRRYAVTRKALALSRAGHYREAVDLYDAVLPELERFSAERWLVTQSEYNRANYFANLGNPTKSCSALVAFVQKNRTATDGWTQVLVGAALDRVAKLKERQGARTEAIESLEDLLGLYRGTEHSQVAGIVGQGMLHLAQLHKHDGNALAEAGILEDLDAFARRTSLPKHILRAARRLRASLHKTKA